MDTLESLRSEINVLDRKMAELYEKRMGIAEAIGMVKQARGLPVYDPAREAAVMKKTAGYIHDPKIQKDFQAVMAQIMANSRKIQERNKKETKSDG